MIAWERRRRERKYQTCRQTPSPRGLTGYSPLGIILSLALTPAQGAESKMATRYALLSIDSPHYGWIESVHHSRETAERALDRACRRVRRRHANALTHLMFGVAAVEADDIARGRARRRGIVERSGAASSAD